MVKIILILFFSGFGYIVFGQSNPVDSLREDFDKSYGLDVLLNNGRKYFPECNPVTGYPFWKSEDSYFADVTIKGKTFSNEKIKYNSYKQEFVLFFTNLNGQHGQIILNSEAIDSIRIGNVLLIPNRLPDIKQKFIQEIYKGKLILYIGWYKELQFNRTGVNVGYIYSKDNQVNYLVYNGVVHRFSGRSSFLHIFSGYKRALIRKYLTSNHIRFKRLDVNELKQLLIYCEKTVF
jgi:hypothetical protein